jgi:large subunit ribosomal protein L15
MANELSNLKPAPGSTKKRMRVGRGEGSGKGKTAGRGTKGQGARGNVKPGFEGGQSPLSRRLPKKGFTNAFARPVTEVRLDAVARAFSAGDVVDASSLVAVGLVGLNKASDVKILGNGDIGFAVTVRGVRLTRSASEKIVAAGGTVEEA